MGGNWSVCSLFVILQVSSLYEAVYSPEVRKPSIQLEIFLHTIYLQLTFILYNITTCRCCKYVLLSSSLRVVIHIVVDLASLAMIFFYLQFMPLLEFRSILSYTKEASPESLS